MPVVEVSTFYPGATAFTRIPRSINDKLKERVNVLIAPLLPPNSRLTL